MLAAEAEVVAKGSGGERTIPVAELWQDYLTTALAPDEVLTEIRVPALEGYGWGYREVHPPRRGLGDGGRGRAGQGLRRQVRGRPHRPHPHGLDAAARHGCGGGAARAAAGRRQHRRRGRGWPPTAPIRPATSTPRRSTSAIWPACSRGARCAPPREADTAGDRLRRAGGREAGARRRALPPDRALSTAVHLAAALSQPLLLEGEAGVGKTEVAKALAAGGPAHA